eukprot:3948521-Prorocentrum_lima.AAC.1
MVGACSSKACTASSWLKKWSNTRIQELLGGCQHGLPLQSRSDLSNTNAADIQVDSAAEAPRTRPGPP